VEKAGEAEAAVAAPDIQAARVTAKNAVTTSLAVRLRRIALGILRSPLSQPRLQQYAFNAKISHVSLATI
jgi:hypothetical protein